MMILTTLFKKGKLEQDILMYRQLYEVTGTYNILYTYRNRQNEKCNSKHAKNEISKIYYFTIFNLTQGDTCNKIANVTNDLKQVVKKRKSQKTSK
jgi:hypothetical protein